MKKKELLSIRLGDRKPGKTRSGWVPGMSAKQIWDAGSRWWVFDPSRGIKCELLLILDPDCTVIGVAEILGVQKYDSDSDRFEIIGNQIKDHEYLGKTVQRGKSQNPVAYVSDSDIH